MIVNYGIQSEWKELMSDNIRKRKRVFKPLFGFSIYIFTRTTIENPCGNHSSSSTFSSQDNTNIGKIEMAEDIGNNEKVYEFLIK